VGDVGYRVRPDPSKWDKVVKNTFLTWHGKYKINSDHKIIRNFKINK
jgi:hypothetical protein